MRIAMTTILKLAALALLALALVAFIACGGSSSGSDGTTSADESGPADEQAQMHMDPVGEERLITMRTENFKFLPETITVKVGEKIRLRLENHDPVLHDYTTDEAEFIVLEADGAAHEDHEAVTVHDDGHEVGPEAQVSLQPLHIAAEGNEHGELVFEATEAGEYEFYCSAPGHREAGMVGTIIIEE